MVRLGRYSFGMGDRFTREGSAQLSAVIEAQKQGADITPVWNKSFREHTTTGTQPSSVRVEADAAIAEAGWTGPYFVDADHINSANVDSFIETSDFFTLDVADYIGSRAEDARIDDFCTRRTDLIGSRTVPGMRAPLVITAADLRRAAERYLLAVTKAGELYRYIAERKGEGNFITEVSMDETDDPQSAQELLIILAAAAEEKIPLQTIAPKFSGRFNKGVDYVGDTERFAREFSDDIAVLGFAVREFGLPENLKLSIHSGSDKFSIFPLIKQVSAETGAGFHLKTAGTTWLEEVIGLAEGGREGVLLVKEVYRKAFDRFEELTAPYAAVIDIDRAQLPSPDEFDGWTSEMITAAVRHDQSCPSYSSHIRQLLHVGYKAAAEMGSRYLDTLDEFKESTAKNVRENMLDRHIARLFL
jgi:tagaturonate epimerase